MPDDFVLLRTAASLQDANLLKSVLEGSGIECVVPGEHFATMYSGVVLTTSGVRVLVRAVDLERAQELLDHPLE